MLGEVEKNKEEKEKDRNMYAKGIREMVCGGVTLVTKDNKSFDKLNLSASTRIGRLFAYREYVKRFRDGGGQGVTGGLGEGLGFYGGFECSRGIEFRIERIRRCKFIEEDRRSDRFRHKRPPSYRR